MGSHEELQRGDRRLSACMRGRHDRECHKQPEVLGPAFSRLWVVAEDILAKDNSLVLVRVARTVDEGKSRRVRNGLNLGQKQLT